VRAEPYRLALQRGESAEVLLHIRNFRELEQEHRIEIHAPSGLIAEPAVLEGELLATSRKAFPVRIKATEDAQAGVAIVSLDVTLDARRYGEWFDFIVDIK
jgi:uncharacterized membrane protein